MRVPRTRLVAGLVGIALVGLALLLLIRPRFAPDPRVTPTAAPDPRVAKIFGGKSGLAIVSHPSKVEAYRLGPLPVREVGGLQTRTTKPADYPILSGPITVPIKIATELSAAFTSAEAYGWDYAKGCRPTYGVRLSFYRGRDQVDVLLCLNCKILIAARDGEFLGGEDFDPIWPILVEAVTAIFPKDPAIQSLKTQPGKPVRGL